MIEDDDAAMADDQEEMGWILRLLKRKYFYAGGSARYMFDYTFDELITSENNSPSVFEQLAGRMSSNDWESFAQLNISDASPSSVSSVMQLIDGRYVPVSEYILRMAHTKCKAQLTASVRAAAVASNNPALRGWAFELEQLDVIEDIMKAAEPRMLVSQDKAIMIPIDSAETTYDGTTIVSTNSDAFTIWCSKRNQGTFDVALYRDTNLTTINFTVAQTHTLKIAHLEFTVSELCLLVAAASGTVL